MLEHPDPAAPPLFVLDQNFPKPILMKAIEEYVLEVRLVPLWDFKAELTRDKEDWEVILGLRQLGAEGFVTCDAAMLDVAKVVAVIEQTRFTVVACAKTGDDPVVATGLLLSQLPRIGKRFDRDKPQIWRLTATEQRSTKIGALKESIHHKSGVDVGGYRLTKAELNQPVV